MITVATSIPKFPDFWVYYHCIRALIWSGLRLRKIHEDNWLMKAVVVSLIFEVLHLNISIAFVSKPSIHPWFKITFNFKICKIWLDFSYVKLPPAQRYMFWYLKGLNRDPFNLARENLACGVLNILLEIYFHPSDLFQHLPTVHQFTWLAVGPNSDALQVRKTLGTWSSNSPENYRTFFQRFFPLHLKWFLWNLSSQLFLRIFLSRWCIFIDHWDIILWRAGLIEVSIHIIWSVGQICFLPYFGIRQPNLNQTARLINIRLDSLDYDE